MIRATKIGLIGIALLGLTSFRASAQTVPDFRAMTLEAVQKSIPLIQKGATGFSANTKCVSCHNQSLPQMTMAVARIRGFALDEKQAKAQDVKVYEALLQAKPLFQAAPKSKAAENALDHNLVDPAMSVGYLMAGMASSQQKSDGLTGLIAQYVAQKQDVSGRWSVHTARPPMEASEFAATALNVRALKIYAPSSPETEARITKARTWLLTNKPRNTEDKAFRLFGLGWTHADKTAIANAIEDLLSDQRDDGGWSQLPNMASDAYATGEALVALYEAGKMSVTASAYNRGRFFLLTTQAMDGSWSVPKRAISVQAYVETGYPYENAQYISIGGACWATIALMYSIDGPNLKPSSAKL